MTKTSEMLQTIIERAFEGGWEGLEMWSKEFFVSCDDTDNLINRIWIEYKDGDGQMFMLRDILFDHDFAKAYWGNFPEHNLIFWNEMGDIDSKVWKMIKPYLMTSEIKHWQYHLQQCVLSDDPITYYFENYDKTTTKPTNPGGAIGGGIT